MLDYFVYLLYRAGFALVTALPLRVLFALGNFTGLISWLTFGKYRRLAKRNVAIAFGNEKSKPELRRIVRRHFQSLGANLLAGIKVGAMPLEELEKRVATENFDILHQHLRAGRGVVGILSHFGNWELFAQIIPRLISYTKTGDIYQKLGNRYVDEHIRRLRVRAGVEMLDRKLGFQKAIELLRSGGAISIPSDQHAGDHGLWVPFFGRLASTTPLASLLAKRADAVLIGVTLYTDAPGRWRIVVTPALETRHDSVESLTAKVNEIIAGQIRSMPEDWFWVHDRWKTPRPNFLLARYKRGVYLPPDITNLKPFRILIRASNWLGDSIISMPAVRAIKAGRPDAHVTIAAPEKIAAAWKLLPEVDEVIPLPRRQLFAAVRAIRRQSPFDVAVLFPNSLRVALEAWLSGIPRRVGYRGHFRSWLLNQIAKETPRVGPPEHQSLQYLRMVKELGAEIGETPIALRPTPNVLSAEPAQSSIALVPGGEYGPAKRWLPERFAEVAKLVAAQRDVQWILFGTKRDAAVGEEIGKALGDHFTNRIGQTTLEQLIDELRACRLLVTNDTGTMHLAALLGLPVIAIFGSTDPRLTGPLGNNHIILRHQVECSPCFLRECPIDFRCMKAVTSQEVAEAVLSILQKETTKDTSISKLN